MKMTCFQDNTEAKSEPHILPENDDYLCIVSSDSRTFAPIFADYYLSSSENQLFIPKEHYILLKKLFFILLKNKIKSLFFIFFKKK